MSRAPKPVASSPHLSWPRPGLFNGTHVRTSELQHPWPIIGGVIIFDRVQRWRCIGRYLWSGCRRLSASKRRHRHRRAPRPTDISILETGLPIRDGFQWNLAPLWRKRVASTMLNFRCRRSVSGIYSFQFDVKSHLRVECIAGEVRIALIVWEGTNLLRRMEM